MRYQWNGVWMLALGFIALAGLRHALGAQEAEEPRSPEPRGEHTGIETGLEVRRAVAVPGRMHRSARGSYWDAARVTPVSIQWSDSGTPR